MVSEEKFKSALSRFASGITIITTADNSGTPVGLTVTAFSSLSLHPPMVLVCIDKSANSYPSMTLKSHFVVNILAEDQEQLSLVFASRSLQDRFSNIRFRLNAHNVPVLDGCLAYLECQVENSYEGGDHTIFVASVVNASNQEGNPLLYYASRYSQIKKRE